MAGQATLIFYPCHVKRKKEKSINMHTQAQKKDPCQFFNKDVQCGIGEHKVPVMQECPFITAQLLAIDKRAICWEMK